MDQLIHQVTEAKKILIDNLIRTRLETDDFDEEDDFLIFSLPTIHPYFFQQWNQAFIIHPYETGVIVVIQKP